MLGDFALTDYIATFEYIVKSKGRSSELVEEENLG
jgi:hypothetical protein